MQKPQVYFAVYDSDIDSDFFAYDTLAEAVSEVQHWLLTGFVENFKNDGDGAEWGRLYVCSVDSSTVPTEYTDGWSLWDYEDSAINMRTIYATWGAHNMKDINP